MRLVKGNRITALSESVQSADRKFGTTITLTPNRPETEMTVRYLKRVTGYIASFDNYPEGMSMTEMVIRGKWYRKAGETEPDDADAEITPEGGPEGGIMEIDQVRISFSFDGERWADITETFAVYNIIGAFEEKTTPNWKIEFNGVPDNEGVGDTGFYCYFGPHDEIVPEKYHYRASAIRKLFFAINLGTGADFEQMKNQIFNISGASDYASMMFRAADFTPTHLCISCNDKDRAAIFKVNDKVTCPLSEIMKAYYIFKNYIYPDGTLSEVLLRVLGRGKIILDTNKVSWIRDPEVEIGELKKASLIPGKGIGPDEFMDIIIEKERRR